MEAKKMVLIIALVLGALFVFFSVCTLALYAASVALPVGHCQGPCSHDTGGVGIVAGLLGAVAGFVLLATFILPFYVESMAQPVALAVLRVLVAFCFFVVLAFYTAAWGLMARDIDNWDSAGSDCLPPGTWGAALACALFVCLLVFAVEAIIVLSVLLDRRAGDSSNNSSSS